MSDQRKGTASARDADVLGAVILDVGRVARELSEALGMPCTAIALPPSPGSQPQVAMADAPTVPVRRPSNTEAEQALIRALDQGGAVAFERRQRVFGVALGWLRQAERDWDNAEGKYMANTWGEPTAGEAMALARRLHDAQVAELFERVGEAL